MKNAILILASLATVCCNQKPESADRKTDVAADKKHLYIGVHEPGRASFSVVEAAHKKKDLASPGKDENILWQLLQEFRLTAEELKAFEGYYQFDQNSNAYLQLTRKENGLIAKQLWDGREFFILPKSSLEFYNDKEEFPAKFSKDRNGKVTQVVVFNRDTWKRTDTYMPPIYISLAAEKLKSFEGKYTFQFEPGTDSFIEITAMQDHLILTEQWSGNSVKFLPISDLKFFSQERAFPLKFTKDSSGVVTQVLAFDRDLWTKVKE